MRDVLSLSNITFERAPESLRAMGLLGFVRLVLNDSLVVDGVQIRHTRDARTIVSWPERKTASGRHRVVHPSHTAAGAALDGEILQTLRQRGDLQ